MQNGSSTLLPRANDSHGFCGTIRQHAEPHRAWMLAIDAVATATSASEEAIRAFLASRSGRHFADEVAKSDPQRAQPRGGDRERRRALDGVAHYALDRDGDRNSARAPYLTGFVLMQEALLSPPP